MLSRLFALFFICSASSLAEGPEKDDREMKEDLHAWSIRSYTVPRSYSDLAKKGQESLGLPDMPSINEDDPEVIRRFIRNNSDTTLRTLKKAYIELPEGTLAVLDEEDGVLAIRTTGYGHRQFQGLRTPYIPSTVAFRMDVLEIMTKDVIQLIDAAKRQLDHSNLLETLEQRVALGHGRVLSSSRAEGRNGMTLWTKDVALKNYGSDFEIYEDGTGGALEFTSKEVGLIAEFSPVVGMDDQIIDLMLSVKYALSDPTTRLLPLASLNGKRVEVRANNFHSAALDATLTMKNGTSRLIGIWQAKDNEGKWIADKQVVAFLTCTAVQQEKPRRLVVLDWLKEHGENVLATPPKAKATASPREEMIVRRFHVPPNFLETGSYDRVVDPVDPFAPETPGKPKNSLTAEEILASFNIKTPEDGWARFLPETSELVVKNFPRDILLITALIGDFPAETRPTVCFQLHIVQADGTTLRKLKRNSMGRADHTPLWTELRNLIAEERASLVRSAWLETKFGHTVETKAVTEFAKAADLWIHHGQQLKKGEGDPKEAAKDGLGPQSVSASLASEDVGLILKIQPVQNSDESIDAAISLIYHTAPPTQRFDAPEQDGRSLLADSPEIDFHQVRLNSNFTTHSGMMRMLGVWKPKGIHTLEDADVLQAAFIETHLVHFGE